MNRLGFGAQMLLYMITCFVIAGAIVWGGILGAQALFSRLPQQSVASIAKEPNGKIGTERRLPPPLRTIKLDKPVEVAAPTQAPTAATANAPTNVSPIAKKKDWSEKSSKAKDKPRRGIPKLSNEAKEAYASGDRPPSRPTELHGVQ